MLRIAILLIVALMPLRALAHAPVFPAEEVRRMPHDPKAFTQGLVWHEGLFVESTGHYGQSTVRLVRPQTGEVRTNHVLPEDRFAEGIAIADGVLHLLTWRSGQGFLLNPETLELSGTFAIPKNGRRNEAWGLARHGKLLIKSDGTSRLTFHRPESFEQVGSLVVKDGEKAVRQINELEMVNNRLLANVWKRDVIAVINPATGEVLAWIDLSSLRKELGEDAGVANGIAWDAAGKHLYVTGKNWEWLFEVAVPGLELPTGSE